MKRPIKVCFIVPSLRPGGAERVISFLADNLDKTQFKATLLVIESDAETAYEVRNIEIIYLNKKRSRNAFWPIFKFLLRNRQDIVLSSIMQLNFMLSVYALFLKKTRFVVRETFVRGPEFRKRQRWHMAWLEKFQKKTIDKVICQSRDIYEDLVAHHGYSENQLVLINNPITKNYDPKPAARAINGHPIEFITVGRLAKQKGYERVLQVLAKFERPFHYTIIGSGSEKERITTLIQELDLGERITHIPFTKKVHEYLAQSDVYLQGSYYEGFPNALLESCTVGTPVMAYEAPGGINEIILDGINGHMVRSEAEFISKLHSLVTNLPDPQRVNESVQSRYNQNIILKQYEALFKELANR